MSNPNCCSLVLTIPATDIAEETVVSEEPTAKRQRIEFIENHVESPEFEVSESFIFMEKFVGTW